MRIPLIAGNWKMNNDIEGSIKLAELLVNSTEKINNGVEVLVCPPFTALYSVKEILKGSAIKLGAQNMHYENNGAYTGEISAEMLKDIGTDYVIAGHSERRQYFNETDDVVNRKLKKAIEFGIKPILCVGETLEERESGIQETTVRNQIINGLKGIENSCMNSIIVAYEPVWAIGTGRTATSIQAGEMAAFIRNTVKELYDKHISENIIILYGGSVKGENAEQLMSQPDIDGALVGGASLKAEEFLNIIKNSGNGRNI